MVLKGDFVSVVVVVVVMVMVMVIMDMERARAWRRIVMIFPPPIRGYYPACRLFRGDRFLPLVVAGVPPPHQ